MAGTADASFEMSAAEFRAASRAKRAGYMFRKAGTWACEGNLWAVPVVAMSTAMAPRGEKAAAFAGGVASTVTFPVFTAGIGATLALIPGVGQGVALWGAMLLAMFPTSMVENGVNRGFRRFSRFGAEVRRLEMGGQFRDTESAFRLRQQAVQEMSAALVTSRRYLGQEARLMHR